MGNENDSRKTADAVARDRATPPCVRLLTSASCAWKGAALPACPTRLPPDARHRPDVARTGEPGGRRRRPRILCGMACQLWPVVGIHRHARLAAHGALRRTNQCRGRPLRTSCLDCM